MFILYIHGIVLACHIKSTNQVRESVELQNGEKKSAEKEETGDDKVEWTAPMLENLVWIITLLLRMNK